MLRDGWGLFVACGSMSLPSKTTTVFLGLVAGDVEVGYYSAADKVIRAVSSVLGPVAQSLYPHLASLKTRSMSPTLSLMRKSFGWILALAAAASLATFTLAGPLVLLLWGPRFAPSIPILRCLSLMPFLFASMNVLGTQTMLVFEMDGLLTRTVLLWAMVHIGLTAVLSSTMGAAGAAMAAVATSAATVLSLAWGLRRRRAFLHAFSEPTCAP